MARRVENRHGRKWDSVQPWAQPELVADGTFDQDPDEVLNRRPRERRGGLRYCRMHELLVDSRGNGVMDQSLPHLVQLSFTRGG
jgi:hypothetical protein